MSEKHNFTVGEEVHFTTTGRYPTNVQGKISAIDDGAHGWVTVTDTDGRARKTRPSTLKRG